MISTKVIIEINKDISREIIQKLDAGLDDLADIIFARSQELVPVDEATLKKSGHVEREFLNKKIGYDAPHAAYIEFGTRPHMPPVEPIQKWARRVLGVSEKEAREVGWKIAKKIAEKGTEPQPFLRPAFDEAQIKAKEIIEKRLK